MKQPFKSISIVGLGYIGLPTAAMLASRGIKVVGVDTNPHAVDTINAGRIHIIEPALESLVSAAVSAEMLRATMVVEPADAFIIAVPTPFKGEHDPDIEYVESAAKAIAKVLKPGDLVILESTSPVGTTAHISSLMAEVRPDLKFPGEGSDRIDVSVAYCPERVLPGRIVQELVCNDRVIGGMTRRCTRHAISLYKTFVEGECIETDASTAEMCKLTENSFRDVNIAFANELSMICEKINIDVWELIKLANRHPRVNILQPGSGVGGHCIAVDPWFIVSKTPREARLIRTAREVNNEKTVWLIEKILATVHQYLMRYPNKEECGVTVACFGLAFKPDIDDLRESPALSIVAALSKRHRGPLLAVEPNVIEKPHDLPSGVELVEAGEALQRANIVVYLVKHSAFLKFEGIVSPDVLTIDACGLYQERHPLIDMEPITETDERILAVPK